MQQVVSAQALADALNNLRLADPMWSEGGFRVSGRWLEIDPDESDALAAQMLECDIDAARRRNDAEARWLVAGGVAVVYVDGRGWQPATLKRFVAVPDDASDSVEAPLATTGVSTDSGTDEY
jgi:hypothetical protein